MAIQKQNLNINFAQGLDTKTDPFQVAPGNFLALENTVFGTGNRLQKRNGYGALTPLPTSDTTLVTTYNGNLTAIGTTLQAYASGAQVWKDKGTLQPITLDTLPLVRSNTNQSYADSVVSTNNLVCTVYIDNIPNGVTTDPVAKYIVADSITGQNIIPATTLAASAGGVVEGSPRVFLLGNYFVIVYSANFSGVHKLEYIAINTINTTSVTTPAFLSLSYTPSSNVAFDGVVSNSNLFLAWNGADIGGAVRMTKLTSSLGQSNTVVFSGYKADLISVSADDSGNTPDIYVTFYDATATDGYTLSVSQNLITLFTPVKVIDTEVVDNLTSEASNHLCTIFYEVHNTYSYDTSIQSNYIKKALITNAGTPTAGITLVRSVGLASKAFIVNSRLYFLAIYSSTYQPTNFVINDSGEVIARLAYSNAGGYYTQGLPTATVLNEIVQIPYLIKDLIQSVNKSQNIANPEGIYSQTGVNLVKLDFGYTDIATAEIGSNLNISGGFMWGYDGISAVENNFHVWPDSIKTTSTTGGSMTAQQYYYQVTYEWSDNQGNIFRSAPSVPISITLTSGTAVEVSVPTLRLTYKISNPVKIVIYRWSTAQQNYYQVTSIQDPILNDTSIDSITFVDKSSDSAILGNNLIYTTGGVVENIAPPSADSITLFQSRLWMVDAENKNNLWYSKQVIPNTPVEMSDLFTIFVAPTIGVNGSTGGITALSTVDDKLVIFKRDALYYISGQGPDNTGANSQYSEPAFITSTVGCANQRSIVLMPSGLMFQSDKGIWLLGRDFSTKYIGAPVEKFTNNASVLSAISIPGTNQVRFTMSTGITLVYDYYYNQWGTFTGVPAIASCLYQNLETFVNQYGQVFQETPNKYLDGSSPVTMKFTTGWMNLAGLQGFERAYFFYILANYLSPHTLNISIAYDYAPSASQVVQIKPDNYSAPYGSDTLWGGGNAWGGNLPLEQWRVFFEQQKCQSFQITVQELFDPSFGVPPGAGLTISGLNMVAGIKKGYNPLKPSRSAG